MKESDLKELIREEVKQHLNEGFKGHVLHTFASMPKDFARLDPRELDDHEKKFVEKTFTSLKRTLRKQGFNVML